METGQNDKIIQLLEYNNIDKTTIDMIKKRMEVGMERYGHGLCIHHDTRKWGTTNDSWEEMALEELSDGLVYMSAAILRLDATKRNDAKIQNLTQILNDMMQITAHLHNSQ